MRLRATDGACFFVGGGGGGGGNSGEEEAPPPFPPSCLPPPLDPWAGALPLRETLSSSRALSRCLTGEIAGEFERVRTYSEQDDVTSGNVAVDERMDVRIFRNEIRIFHLQKKSR